MTREEAVAETLTAHSILRGNEGEPDEDLVSDLLADLMHFCKAEGIDFEKRLFVAEINYESEK